MPVKVPRPERLAWHKMAVAELRHETSDKKRKDVGQASVLFAILTEDEPAALADVRKVLPASLVSKVRRATPGVEANLSAGGRTNAVELLRDLL